MLIPPITLFSLTEGEEWGRHGGREMERWWRGGGGVGGEKQREKYEIHAGSTI